MKVSLSITTATSFIISSKEQSALIKHGHVLINSGNDIQYVFTGKVKGQNIQSIQYKSHYVYIKVPLCVCVCVWGVNG